MSVRYNTYISFGELYYRLGGVMKMTTWMSGDLPFSVVQDTLMGQAKQLRMIGYDVVVWTAFRVPKIFLWQVQFSCSTTDVEVL